MIMLIFMMMAIKKVLIYVYSEPKTQSETSKHPVKFTHSTIQSRLIQLKTGQGPVMMMIMMMMMTTYLLASSTGGITDQDFCSPTFSTTGSFVTVKET